LKTSKKKRSLLLKCAREDLDLREANQRLADQRFKPVSELDWKLWTTYFVNIVDSNMYFERELVENNRPLAWFARTMNERRKRNVIS
tara:strand:- start:48562 stop:48822 length:261 start_codon:yes stop_codon:yes gene_type:complete